MYTKSRHPPYLQPPFDSSSSTQIGLPLSQHPRQRRRSHNQRAQEATTQRGITKDKLSHKVCQGNTVGPQGEIVRDGRVDVVGGSHANDRGEEGPSAKDTTGERLDGNSAIGIELGGVIGGAVGL